MKHLLTLLLITTLAVGTQAQPLDRSVRPQAAAPSVPVIAAYQKFTLKNGLTLVVVENHKLPRLNISLNVENYGVLEGDKAGFGQIMGEMLSEGTTQRSKSVLDEEVDFIGARLNTGAFGIQISGLSKYGVQLFDLLSDVALHPLFSQEAFDKLKEKSFSSLKSEKDDPSAIQTKVSNALLFGKDHPKGEMVTEASLSKASLEDCKTMYSTYWKPGSTVLLVVGDCKPKEVKKWADAAFGTWTPGTAPKEKFPMPAKPEKTAIAFVNRDASVQSNIQLANTIQVKTGDADVEALRVMNEILGGGSSGRLFLNLREDKAYTYGAYSSFALDKYVGQWEASGEVRNAVTDSAVDQFLFELHRIRTELVSETDLQNAKQNLAGAFGRSLESPGTVANFALNTLRYQLSPDYYNQYLTRLAAVTSEDVRRVANKYIETDRMLISIVGKATQVGASLERIASVQYYDLEANKTERPSMPVPEGMTAATVVDQYIEAIGGMKALVGAKDLTLSQSATIQGITLQFKEVHKAPNKHHEMQSSPMGKQESFFDGKKGRLIANGKNQPLTDDQLEEMRSDAVMFPELSWKSAPFALALEPQMSVVEGKICTVLLVTHGKSSESHYFDIATGLRVRTSSTQQGPQGEMVVNIDFSDYRSVGGILFPYVTKLPIGPGMVLEVNTNEILVNSGVADSFFK